MSDIMHKYYNDLYDTEETDPIIQDEVILSLQQKYSNKRITEKENSTITNQIPKEEIEKVIKSLQNNKTPGPDGIPNEFFKQSKEMIPTLHKIFNEFIDKKSLPSTLLDGNIIAIF